MALPLGAQTTFIDASSGDWATAASWNQMASPGSLDTADVGTYAVSVSSAESVGSLNLSGGSLSGAGSLLINAGNSTWSGGSMDSLANLTVGPGASLAINGSGNLDFNGTALVNNGSVSWTSGVLRTGNGGGFTNGGSFTDSNPSGSIYNPWGGGGTFTNGSGSTYTKSSGVTNIQVPLANSGTVSVTGGTLNLDAGASFNNGSALNNTGGTLDLASGTFASSGAIQVAGVTFFGGEITGTPTFSGSLTWTGGDMDSANTTSVTFDSSSTLTVSGAVNHDFNGSTLTNQGTVDWTAGVLRTGSGGSLVNQGQFNDSASSWVQNPWGGGGTFTNASTGTYAKLAPGETDIQVPFANSGSVNVQAGTLSFQAGGSSGSTGSMTAGSGTTIEFSGGAFSVSDGATFSGAGLFELTAGSLSLGGTFSIPNARQTGGSLGGSFCLESSAYEWLGGDWDNVTTGYVGEESTLTIDGAVNHDFYGATLYNKGTVDWTAGALRTGNGGSFTNEAAFNDSNASGSINNPWGGGGTFTNASGATYTKSSGVTDIQVPFVNSGTVNVTGGTLNLDEGATLDDRSSLANPGGVLSLSSGTFSASGTVYVSNVLFAGGEITGTPTFSGTMTWAGGDMNSSNTTSVTFDSSSTLTVINAINHDLYASTLTNQGTVDWNAGNLRTGNGGSLVNQGQFNDSASAAMQNPWGGGGSFLNTSAGTYSKLAPGETDIGVPFTNSGTVTVEAGTLNFLAGGSSGSTGSMTANAGTVIEFGGGTFSLTGGAAFHGTGLFELTAGSLSLSGSFSIPNALQTGGSLAGNFCLESSAYEWLGGDWDNVTTGYVGEESTLTIDGTVNHDFYGATLYNKGTVDWAAGALRTGNGGSFTNEAAFNDSNASGSINNPWGGGGTFTNASGATYTKSSGVTDIQVPFVNSGTVNVTGGTLNLDAGGTLGDGSGLYSPGGNIQLAGGAFAASGTIGVSSLSFTGGEITGTPTFSGTMTWAGGDLDSANTTSVTFDSSSTLTVSGAVNHDFNGSSLTNDGTFNWTAGNLRTGNGGSFTNNGSFNDTASGSFANPWGGGATFTNSAGATYTHSVSGTTTFSGVAFANQGTIAITAGSVDFAGGFTNAGGTLSLAGGGAGFSGPADFTSGSVLGNGSVSATTLTVGQSLFPGANAGAGTLSVTGDLALLSTSVARFNIGGPGAGTQYDQVTVSGSASLGGDLSFSFTNGFLGSVNPSETFTLLSASSLTGSFLNVANGGELLASGGMGWFTVNYGPSSAFGANELVLSDFTPVPEPATWVLMGLGAAVLAVTAGWLRPPHADNLLKQRG